MQKGGFLRWYIGAGLREMCAMWKRFVIFIPWFFSFALLVRTLFAPWHRDISLKDWRGLNIAKSTQRIFWSLFARIIGAIVRLCVIAFGLVVWVGVVIGGGVAVALYCCAPLVIVMSIALFATPYMWYAVGCAVVTMGIVLYAYRIYRISGHIPYKQMTMVELSQQPWFYRVLERIGVDAKSDDMRREMFRDFAMFEAFLKKHNVSAQEFEMIVAWEIEKQLERENKRRIFSAKNLLAKRPIGLWWHFGYTVQLDRYAQDLTRFDNSRYAQFFHGFDQEMDMMQIVLARPHENNVMITGAAGTGRHMMVHELARRIRTGYYDGTFLQHMRVLQCDFTGIIAQAKTNGDDPEYVIHSLFHEAAFAGNVIFVVDKFEQYMDTNDTRGFSFSAIIDQYASQNTFRMIALATDTNFHDAIEHNRVLMRHFDVISVEEMSEEETMKVLFMRFYGAEHTPFTFQALRQIIAHSHRYTNTGPLPSRAIDLATEVLVAWQKSADTYITERFVDAFVQEKTGIPIGDVKEEESQTLLSLEELFHRRIVGQDEAVRTVAAAVRRMRSGMTHGDKPAGSFLFLGPTGVGKTEMAKTLAQQYYGSEEHLIRLDMSEFQGDNALDRLIGSKELGQQGILTTAARENPYTLLLLDEIEKANPRVLDVFLQVLDEGFLHDAFGRKVNFTTMIIIATSNAAAALIKKMIEMDVSDDDMKKKVIDNIITTGSFRPEFLNRFDDVVIFHPLGEEHVVAITQMLLARFCERMHTQQYVTVVFDDDVADRIIAQGFDPVFGARSLIHYIDDAIADALAKKMIAGNVHRGDTVHFGVADMDV